MIINVSKKYEYNVSTKYDCDNKQEYNAAYTKKEQDMWFFAEVLLKKDEEKDVYDSNNKEDVAWLNRMLKIVLKYDGIEQFTLEEWFKFMASQPESK